MACCYSLASVTAATPRFDWIDVCTYSDPTGYTCCPPGMENKEYLVVAEDHDWFGHSQACRSEYFTGRHSHWSVSLEILSSHWWTDEAKHKPQLHSDIGRLYGGARGWLAVLEEKEEASCLQHYIITAYDPSFQRYAISLKTPYNMPGVYYWLYPNGSSGRDTK